MLALLASPSYLENTLSTLCGVLMILLFLISSTLNPLIYYCFTRQKSSIINYLFKIVAVLDFLANLPSLVVAVLSLSPTRYGVFWPSTLGLVSCVTGCVAQATTTLLAITRYFLLIIVSNLVLQRSTICISDRILLYYELLFATH